MATQVRVRKQDRTETLNRPTREGRMTRQYRNTRVDRTTREDRTNNQDPMSREKVSAWLAQPHHHLLTIDAAGYPPMLRQTDGAPFYLFVRGDPGILARPMIAIVGSRNSTVYGLSLIHI